MLRNGLFAVVLAAAIGYVVLTGCTTSPKISEAPTPASTSSASSLTASPSRSVALKGEELRQEAIDYMRSSERIERYKQVWGAAEKVARALYAGQLGPVVKYDENKADLARDYTGWGGIQSSDRQFYAWVWWNTDGTIDYARGVTGFAVRGLQVESVDTGSGPYHSFISRSSTYTDVVDASSISDANGAYGQFKAPTTLSELKNLDNEVLTLIPVNLAAAGLS